MRKLVTAVMACSIIAFAAAGAWGTIAGPADMDVSTTLHNLSTSSTGVFNSPTEDQICIFCHTPHNASPNLPLWNKVLPTQSFNMYTSSSTLTSVAKKVKAPSTESLLCLSCHDGRTAINVLHNTQNGIPVAGGNKAVSMNGADNGYYDNNNPNGQAFSLGFGGFGSNYGANLGKTASDNYYGGNLTDDHPISFSYKDAYNEKVSNSDTSLRSPTDALSRGVRFFGGTAYRIECSSCHNPHVKYGPNKWDGGAPGNPDLRPFLVRDNVGSALCLACHNK